MKGIVLDKLIDKTNGELFYSIKVDNKTTVKSFLEHCELINGNTELNVYIVYDHCGKIPIYYKSETKQNSYTKGYGIFKNLIIEKGYYTEYSLDGKGYSSLTLILKEASWLKKIFCRTIRRKDFYELYERFYGALCM